MSSSPLPEQRSAPDELLQAPGVLGRTPAKLLAPLRSAAILVAAGHAPAVPHGTAALLLAIDRRGPAVLVTGRQALAILRGTPTVLLAPDRRSTILIAASDAFAILRDTPARLPTSERSAAHGIRVSLRCLDQILGSHADTSLEVGCKFLVGAPIEQTPVGLGWRKADKPTVTVLGRYAAIARPGIAARKRNQQQSQPDNSHAFAIACSAHPRKHYLGWRWREGSRGRSSTKPRIRRIPREPCAIGKRSYASINRGTVLFRAKMVNQTHTPRTRHPYGANLPQD